MLVFHLETWQWVQRTAKTWSSNHKLALSSTIKLTVRLQNGIAGTLSGTIHSSEIRELLLGCADQRVFAGFLHLHLRVAFPYVVPSIDLVYAEQMLQDLDEDTTIVAEVGHCDGSVYFWD